MCQAPLLPDDDYVAATRAAGNPSFLTGTLYIKSSDQSVPEGSPLPGNTSVEIINTKFLQNLCRWVSWLCTGGVWPTRAGPYCDGLALIPHDAQCVAATVRLLATAAAHGLVTWLPYCAAMSTGRNATRCNPLNVSNAGVFVYDTRKDDSGLGPACQTGERPVYIVQTAYASIKSCRLVRLPREAQATRVSRLSPRNPSGQGFEIAPACQPSDGCPWPLLAALYRLVYNESKVHPELMR